jgi:hypothetical protein
LLFALARREANGACAIDLTIRGAPLKAVAAAAGVPLWLRKLPPEAFVAPFDGLPDSEVFRRKIANHLPRSPKLAACWLASVWLAAKWGDEDLAVWIAREILRRRKASEPERLRLLALYAWYSQRTQTAAHACLRRPWEAGMTYGRAVAEAEAWREGVVLNLYLHERRLDPWLEPATVMGFEFIPLRTSADIAQEARIMRNCVRRFGYSLRQCRQRLWSIKHGGERVATLSVGFRRPILDILELMGPANAEAPKAVWVAARRWIDSHDLMAIERSTPSNDKVLFDRSAWISLWRPYWLAKRRIPNWLPLAPSPAALQNLRSW